MDLRKVLSNLTNTDRRIVKILCGDRLPKHTKTLTIETVLCNLDNELIYELLFHCGRYDLLNILGKNFRDVMEDIKWKSKIDPHR